MQNQIKWLLLAPDLRYNVIHSCCLFPYYLMVRIPGSHPGGPGSIPGMGYTFSVFYEDSKHVTKKTTATMTGSSVEPCLIID